MKKKRDLVILAVSLALIVFSAVMAVSRLSGRGASQQAERELRDLYHAEQAKVTGVPTLTPERKPEAEPPEETAAPAAVAAESPAETAPEPVRISRLKRSMYPRNPGLRISESFKDLRKQNADIVGWLTVGKMLDEAVVQRDNEFYMNHDVSGRENAGGAVFLDQIVSLRSRPYSLVLYGHNMRDGSRFGWLRKYEDPKFYRENLFIDFNTVYEEGRYVVFSEGTISTEEADSNYLDFFDLDSLREDDRERAIGVLQAVSVHDSGIDVRTDDQLLVLVTCVDRDTDRRIVAARRIREDETEAGLRETVVRN